MREIEQIQINTPATYCIGSDRYGGKIVDVKLNGMILVFADRRGETSEFSLRKTGKYISKGSKCGTLLIGEAIDYMDPSF